jgi:hypothetical protein
MTNDADRALRELFAEPSGEEAADPVFVAKVMGQIARRRRVRTAAGAGVAVALLVGTFLFAGPSVTTSTNVAAALPLLLTSHFQRLLLSPIGFAVSLPVGILVLALSALRRTNLNA